MCSIATVASDGVLLYNGRYGHKHDYIALLIVNGVPAFEYAAVGARARRTVLADRAYNHINDGHWHTVLVEYDEGVRWLVYNMV
jgi:hypothetical protein